MGTMPRLPLNAVTINIRSKRLYAAGFGLRAPAILGPRASLSTCAGFARKGTIPVCSANLAREA